MFREKDVRPFAQSAREKISLFDTYIQITPRLTRETRVFRSHCPENMKSDTVFICIVGADVKDVIWLHIVFNGRLLWTL
jgi:hypothetical protein